MSSRILCSGLFLVVAASAFSVRLTGLNGTPTDSNGNWHTGWYNTYGDSRDPGKNAYLAMGDANGVFLNSGNTASSLALDIDLSRPGVYSLFAFFDGREIYAGRDFWSLNLFFDGETMNPGISVYGRPDYVGSQTPPEVWANSRRQLDVTGRHGVLGSGSFTFGDVRLTGFRTMVDSGLDRVNNFAIGASGRTDHVAQFTLEVVPEPASWAALGLGLVTLRRLKSKGS